MLRTTSITTFPANASAYGIDTLAVLYLLAFEYGRAVVPASTDGALMGVAMAMVLVFPYFFPTTGDRPQLSSWMLVRGAAAVIGIAGGAAFGLSVGVLIPQSLKFVPMALLMLAVAISFCIQSASFFRLHSTD
jgi:hypothetical protein